MKNEKESINKIQYIIKIYGIVQRVGFRPFIYKKAKDFQIYEYKDGHLPTAKNISMDIILLEEEKHLDKSKEYHIICQSGGRSSRTCGILKEKGFNVINVSGGTIRYRGRLER